MSKSLTPVEICRRRRLQVLTLRGYVNLAVKLVTAVIVAVVVFSQIFLITRCSGMGMFPALRDGDLVLAYRLHSDYEKGDVVVYTVDGISCIGRIVARENDIVMMDDTGALQVNGVSQNGEILYPTYAKLGIEYPYQVQEDSWFLLGDYRTQCEDSRDYGSIPMGDIQGKVITIARRRGI